RQKAQAGRATRDAGRAKRRVLSRGARSTASMRRAPTIDPAKACAFAAEIGRLPRRVPERDRGGARCPRRGHAISISAPVSVIEWADAPHRESGSCVLAWMSETNSTAERPRPVPEADRLRLERMFADHHATIWRSLRRRGLTPDEAADATQETFL